MSKISGWGKQRKPCVICEPHTSLQALMPLLYWSARDSGTWCSYLYFSLGVTSPHVIFSTKPNKKKLFSYLSHNILDSFLAQSHVFGLTTEGISWDTQLNLEALVSTTDTKTLSIPGQVPCNCRCTWSLHFDFHQQSLPGVQVSDTGCHRAILNPSPCLNSFITFTKSTFSPSHPGPSCKGGTFDVWLYAHHPGH